MFNTDSIINLNSQLSNDDIPNNYIPEIPKEYINSFLVFHVRNEKIIKNNNDLDYGIMSNISPLWWSNLVIFENTGNKMYLDTAKKYSKSDMLVVFYPELLLNLNQQRRIEEILCLLDYDKNILIKTNSPFIIQTCHSHSNAIKKMIYLGGRDY